MLLTACEHSRLSARTYSLTGGGKAKKGPSNSWFAPSKAPAWDEEPLFLALVLLADGIAASDARLWAQETVSALTPLPGATVPELPAAPEWRMDRSKPGAGIARLHAALKRSWPTGCLERIGAAMQAWRGPGRHDRLTHKLLLRYVQGPAALPLSPTPAGAKHGGPPRWRSAPVLLAVARCIPLVF